MLNEIQDVVKADYVSFTCDGCGEQFDLSKFLLRYRSSKVLIPTLKYSVPTNHNDRILEKHFCSKECLIQLLKEVPFSFEVSSPILNFKKEETK